MHLLCDFTPPAEGKLTPAWDDMESQSKFYLWKVNGKWVNALGNHRLVNADRGCGTAICKCDEVDSVHGQRRSFSPFVPPFAAHGDNGWNNNLVLIGIKQRGDLKPEVRKK